MSQDTPKGRRQVERIEDWDHARYSITPPRAALDLRLTLIHFRLMAMLGRVNTRQGWCEMSQTKFAEALGYARGSVVRAVKELVDWHYVEKKGQEEAGSARCHYRLLVDDPEPESAETCHVGGDTPTCHVGGDTPVTSQVTHVSRTWDTKKEDHRSEITPPQPPAAAGDAGNGKPSDRTTKGRRGPDWERIFAGLRSKDPARNLVLDLLVMPVLSTRHLDAPTASSAITSIIDFAVSKGLGEKGLRSAANTLASRRSTVKPSDFEAAILFGLGMQNAKPARPEITIRPSDVSWTAWLEHIVATKGQEAADAVERAGLIRASARWPGNAQPAAMIPPAPGGRLPAGESPGATNRSLT